MTETVRTCVIFNPTSGRGRARRGIARQRSRCGPEFEFRATQGPAEAETIAQRAIDDGFTRIIAAGGDGTCHEVANGILESGNSDIIFSVWPFGSANDYAFTLGITGDLDQARTVRLVDVGRITNEAGRSRYFVNGLGLGFNSSVTIEARKIRWLRGMPLYGLAIFKSMFRHFHKPTMRFQFDELIREAPTLAFTLNLGKREGGFPLTPRAELDDGLFDYMQAGPIARSELIRHFPNMAAGTLPKSHPRMWLGQCHHLGIESSVALRIHLDGEFFCHPEEGCKVASVDLLSRRLRVEAAASLDSSGMVRDAAATLNKAG